ncbi:MAG: PQQ-binding-like beta-propeller repeat protein [Planctomycetota bacterium]
MPGVRSRVRFALAMLPKLASQDVHFANGLTPGDFQARGLDRQEAGWPHPASLPANPMDSRFGYQFQPSTDGERVFVSTSRQVIAYGGWTGEVQWESPLSEAGWDARKDRDGRFQEAIDYRGALYQPAVSQGVVVASLQLPFVLIPPEHFRQIQIIRIMPERRLFAWRADTGELLWHHAPRHDWDGESGPVAERVSVAGPPTIAGSRVLVPTVRVRGRIEFHVDCFDLETGEHLWHTPLVTGQRELNMFSREIGEFTAPPVRVEGNRVIVATSIGSVACLDLIRGETLWQSLYTQIEISKATYYSPGQMRSLWTHSRPVVTDGLVIVAPNDSNALHCFNLETGAHLWSWDHAAFRLGQDSRYRRDLLYLVDADAHRVILGGGRVAAFRPTAGDLHKAPPDQLEWVFPTAETISNPGLRPVAAGGGVLVPCDHELIRVDRASGRPTSSLEWSSGKGSVLLTEVGLFTAGFREVRGYFDWQESLRQAEADYRETPGDPEVIYRLGLLRQKHGLAQRMARPTPDLDGALRSFASARELLEKAVAEAPQGGGGSLRSLLFQTLIEEGRTLRQAAAPDRARRTIEQALELAAEPSEISRSLLLLAGLDEGKSGARRRARLLRLAQEFGDMEIPCVIAGAAARPDGLPGQRYEPVEGLVQSDVTPAEDHVHTLPLGLWARMELARSLLSPEARNEAPPFEELYAVIDRYGDWPWLDGYAADAALQALREFLDQRRTAGLEVIEQRAQESLAEATGDGDLREVQRRFPLTQASEAAGEQRIAQAARDHQVALLAEVVLGSASLEYSLERATDRQRSHLALLAATIGDAGGLMFRAELGKRLAASAPRQMVDLGRDEPRSLSEWSLLWSAQVPVPRPAPTPEFTTALSNTGQSSQIAPVWSRFVPPALEASSGADAQRPVFLMPWRDEDRGMLTVAAFSDSPTPIWVHSQGGDADIEHLWAVSPGRVHTPLPESVLTIDRETGSPQWLWHGERNHSLVHLTQAQGVVVATLEQEAFGEDLPTVLLQVGLEASTGTELWRRRFQAQSFRSAPIVGSGVLVLLSEGRHPSQVFDLFSGAAGPSLDLGPMKEATLAGAWIEDGRLIVPNFGRVDNSDQNHIEAWDLARGVRLWRTPFGPGRELWRVLRYQGETLLELTTYPQERGSFKGIHTIDLDRGQLSPRPKLDLGEDSRLIGLPKSTTIELQEPWVFARTLRPSGYILRAFELGRGPRWEVQLPDRAYLSQPDHLNPVRVSGKAAVLAVPRKSEGRNMPDTANYYVLVYDRDTGRATADLLVRLGPSRTATRAGLVPLGRSLVLGTEHNSEILGE